MTERPLAGIKFLRTDDAAERLGWTEDEVLGAVGMGEFPAIRTDAMHRHHPMFIARA